jgi:hypothetical protein
MKHQKNKASSDNAKTDNNVVKLLIMIRGYCCQFDNFNNEYMPIVKSLKTLFYFFQKKRNSQTLSSMMISCCYSKLSKSVEEQDRSPTSLI